MSLSQLFPGFRRLSKNIYIVDPAEPLSKTTTNATMPAQIFLLTWADAHPKHIVKYVQGYQGLYPSARIIVVQATTFGTFFAGRGSPVRKIQPLITEQFITGLAAPHSEEQKRPTNQKTPSAHLTSPTGKSPSRNLFHVFSNSGATNLEAMCDRYLSMHQASLPLDAVIFDSTPGGSSYRTEGARWTAGVAAGFGSRLPSSLPKPLLTALAFAMSAPLVICMMIIPQMLGYEILPERCSKAVNDPKKIPIDSSRLYIYWKAIL